jgi:hypothetical protein
VISFFNQLALFNSPYGIIKKIMKILNIISARCHARTSWVEVGSAWTVQIPTPFEDGIGISQICA